MAKIYTIGFKGKSAEEFFSILKNAGVKRVIDVRLYPSTQLSGFACKKDLGFFLKNLCGIAYQHNVEIAPTDEILKGYKDKKISWADYVIQYIKLLEDKYVIKNLNSELLDVVCFICAEQTAE